MQSGGLDLEALEVLTRQVMHGCGAMILKKLLACEDGDSLGDDCECGGRFVNRKRGGKTIRTVVGKVRIARTIQRCKSCGAWRGPLDDELDVAGTGFLPACGG